MPPGAYQPAPQGVPMVDNNLLAQVLDTQNKILAMLQDMRGQLNDIGYWQKCADPILSILGRIAWFEPKPQGYPQLASMDDYTVEAARKALGFPLPPR